MKKRSLFLILLVMTLILPLVPASAATYYYVSGTTFLKIREKPNSTAKVLDSYRADFAVVSYKKYNANWAYVHFSDGAEGYVMRRYLKASTTSTAYVTKDKSALRSGPAASFSQTATLYQGDKVKVLSSGAVWSYVSAGSGTGYVKKSLLSSKYVKKSGNQDTPYTGYVKNSSGRTVNVRQGAGKGYSVVTELSPGTQVIVEEIDGKWSRISRPVSGWMLSTYLTKKMPTDAITLAPVKTPTPTTDTKIRYITSANGKSVNVRHGPSETGYAVLTSLKVGTEVTVVSTENGWSKIKCGVISGWVKNEFLTSQKPGTTPKPTATPAVPAFKSFKATVQSSDGGPVNLRRDAGKGYATVTQVPNGEKVKVVGEKGNWYKIEYKTYTGYMMKEYVVK